MQLFLQSIKDNRFIQLFVSFIKVCSVSYIFLGVLISILLQDSKYWTPDSLIVTSISISNVQWVYHPSLFFRNDIFIFLFFNSSERSYPPKAQVENQTLNLLIMHKMFQLDIEFPWWC